MKEERIVTPTQMSQEHVFKDVRPKSLAEYMGQEALKEQLKVFLNAALEREEALDHVLVSGPPGLGKTTLAHVIAHEMGANLRQTSGPVLVRAGDLAAILSNLQPHDVLFIDEIHRLNHHVEEILYPALEDRKLDLMLGEGPAARSVQIPLPPFTLVGATTRTGLLTSPLRDRFGIAFRLDFYSQDALTALVAAAAQKLEVSLSQEAAVMIAQRSRGTPRIAQRLLRRARDFATCQKKPTLQVSEVDQALRLLGVDEAGLDALDRKIIQVIQDLFDGGPVGLETLSAALGEESDTLEYVVEPYLLQLGFIQRTPKGRVLTPSGLKHWEQAQQFVPQKA